MRARLLDMGEVGAVRSQSLVRAAAAALEPDSAPVLILVKPAEPLVVLGGHEPGTGTVPLELCRAEGIPVVRAPISEPAWFLGPSHLLLSLVAPAECAAALGLTPAGDALPEAATRALRAVGERLEIAVALGDRGRLTVDARALARVASLRLGDAAGVVWDLRAGLDRRECALEARLLAAAAGSAPEDLERSLCERRTGFSELAGAGPGFAELAEALVAAAETTFALELVPSMPTPAELVALYEWDERLPVTELLDGPAESGERLNSFIM